MHLRTPELLDSLKSRAQELSSGIWHVYIGQYRSVIYRWKALKEHFFGNLRTSVAFSMGVPEICHEMGNKQFTNLPDLE